MSTLSNSQLLLYLIFLTQTLLVFCTYNDGKRIYLTSSNQIAVKFTLSADKSVGSCNCTETGVISACTTSKNGLEVTFSLTKSGGGYCTLMDTQTTPVLVQTISILEEINYSPNNGFETTDSLITLVSTPSLTSAQWKNVLKNATLQPSFNPTISLTQPDVVNTPEKYLFTAAQKTILLPSLSKLTNGDQHRELDFDIVVTPEETEVIGKPFLLYEIPTITSIVPQLVKINELITFDINFGGVNNVPLSNEVAVIVNGVSLVGKVISSTVVRFQHTLTNALQQYEFSASFDKQIYINSTTTKIFTFDFPAATSIAYSPGIYPDEKGCSIFGHNNLTIKVFDEIDATFRNAFTPLLKISSGSLEKIQNCGWDIIGKQIVCPCAQLYNGNLNLPQMFPYSLSFDNNKYFSPALSAINYFKLDDFIVSSVGNKDDISVDYPIYISHFENRFDSSFNYSWFVKNIDNNEKAQIDCSLLSKDQFKCTNLTILTNNGTNPDLNRLCGSQFSNSTPCALYFDVHITGSLNQNSPLEQLSASPYYVYPQVTVSSFDPDVIILGEKVTMKITGGIFLNTTISAKFVATTNDTYGLNTCGQLIESGNCTVGNISVPCNGTSNSTVPCPVIGDIKTSKVQFVSQNEITFENFAASKVALYHLYLSFNNISYQKTNTELLTYEHSMFNYSRIFNGDNKPETSPEGNAKVTIAGSNFLPSRHTKVKYVSTITLYADCATPSRSQMTCNTGAASSTGILLPKVFSVEISFNDGRNWMKTGLNITYLESETPIIVQTVPSRAPSNHPTSYNITVKGVAPAGTTKCLFTPPGKNQPNTPGDPDEITFNGVVRQSDEMDCEIDPTQLTINGYYKFRVYNPTSQLPSTTTQYLFYEHPTITKVEPNSGKAKGGVDIILHGSGFKLQNALSDTEFESVRSNLGIRLKMSDTLSNIDCTVINDTKLQCTTPPHPEGQNVPLYISYNSESQYTTSNTSTYSPLPCSAGYQSQDFEKECEPCSIGYFKPESGFFNCLPCALGEYQPSSNSTKCIQCSGPTTTYATGATNKTDCDCLENFYRLPTTTSGIDCTSCPDGAICAGKGIQPRVKPGFWYNKDLFENKGEYKFIACSTSSWCTGNSTINGGCITGRDGEACKACAYNYFRSSGTCQPCDNDVRWRMVIIVLFLAVVLLFVFKFAQLKVSHLSSISIVVAYFQIIAVFSTYNFKWPAELKQALNAFKFLNLDLDIFVPECITTITYAMKWIATILIPLGFAGVLFLGFLLECARTLLARLWGPFLSKFLEKIIVINKKNWLTIAWSSFVANSVEFITRPKSNKEVLAFGDKCIHSFVIILSFSYVFVVTKAAQVFHCAPDAETGISLMVSEPYYQCWVGEWFVFFPFAVITLILFGGGVFIFFAYIVINKKKSMTSKSFNARFRFLFVRFRDERLYWQMIIILRKMLISLAIIFFSAGFELLIVLFSMMIIFVAFVLQMHNLPYRRKFHNFMEYTVLISTQFLFFCALLFFVDKFPEPQTIYRSVLGYFCIGVIVLSSVVIVGLMILDFLLQFKEDKEEARLKHEELSRLENSLADPLIKFKEKRKQKSSVEPNDEDEYEIEQPTLIDNNPKEKEKLDIKGQDIELIDINQDSSNSLIPGESSNQLLPTREDQNSRIEIEDTTKDSTSPDYNATSSTNLLDRSREVDEYPMSPAVVPITVTNNDKESDTIPINIDEPKEKEESFSGIAEISEEAPVVKVETNPTTEDQPKEESFSGIAEIPDEEQE